MKGAACDQAAHAVPYDHQLLKGYRSDLQQGFDQKYNPYRGLDYEAADSKDVRRQDRGFPGHDGALTCLVKVMRHFRKLLIRPIWSSALLHF